MAQWLDFKGRVIDAGHARSRKTEQFFYLVQDLRTSIKYPVVVSVERTRGRRAEQEFSEGDIVHVTGRMQAVLGVPLAGMKMIEKSDVQKTDATATPFSNVMALIPEEMTAVKETPGA